MAEETKQRKSVFDTDRQYLGDVYAKALLGLAGQSGNVDSVLEELDSFVDVLDAVPKLRATLESPRISFTDKETILDKALKGKASPIFLNFVKVVCRKGRADCLTAISNSARTINDESAGRIQATMITAVPVNDDVKKSVTDRLSQVIGKTVLMTAEVDPSIVGGLVVRVGDTVYDSSVTNQLEQVRSSAIGRANIQIREALDRFATEA